MNLAAVLGAIIGASIIGIMWVGSSEFQLRGARRDFPTMRRLRRRDRAVLAINGAKSRRP